MIKYLILHINTFVENVIKNLIIQNVILVLTQVIWKLIQKKWKNDKIWWCWECGKNATFHYVGRPLNIAYKYLCRVCYFELAEPKNYIKYKNPFNNIASYGILGGIMRMMAPITRNEICYKCLKFPASYESIK